MKRIFALTMLLGMTVADMLAQRIDFNMSGRQEAEGLAIGYTAWTFGRQASDTRNFLIPNTTDSVTITISAVSGLGEGNGIRTNYWKDGVTKYNYKLVGDMAIVTHIDEENNCVDIKEGSCGLQLQIFGLPAGKHTLMAYHSNTDNIGENVAPLDVLVDGEVVAENVKQRARGVKPSECPFSYITFTAKQGRTVTVQYITKPVDGTSYASTAPCLNAIVFDEANPLTSAHDPYPVNGDYHVDCDKGTYMLQWSSAQITPAKHHLMVGTAPSQEKELAVLGVADTCYTLKDLTDLDIYYWRVDEETADGTIGKGEEWSFQPRHLAFPGAEGYGRYARGGRGGYVYHVTNLDGGDTTPGSFGYGLRQSGAHTIVFDVSGIIDMNYQSVFSLEGITVAPQTAPGKGICIQHSSLNFNSDCIVRHLRAKRGYGGSEHTGNAVGVTGADHTILDHITAAWGTDETFSSRGAKNITFQYNIIAEALGIADHKNYDAGKNHGFAATIGGDYGTFSHNLLVNCSGRNWSMGGGVDGAGNCAGELDMFNNVCYNWNGRTTDGGAKWMQFVNNYYKMGPDTKHQVLFTAQNEGGGARTQFAYVNGNIRENKDGSLTEDKLGVTYDASGPEPEKTWVSERFFPSYATIHTAQEAFKIVCSDAGATMPCRDDQHKRVVSETVNGTWTFKGSKSGIRGEIDREYDITGELDPSGNDTGGWEYWPEESRAADFDTDQDGMPDWYEHLIGSNASLDDHNEDPDHNGYTLLEDYLDFMSHPYLILAPCDTKTYDIAVNFAGFTKTPTYTATANNSIASVSISGSIATVVAGQTAGIGVITLQVTDSEGTSMTQQLSVAVTGEQTAIHSVAEDEYTTLKREIFTLDGKHVKTFGAQDAYIIRETDTNGRVHTLKAIRR